MPTSAESLDADVIVVGAGPVGLLLGAELALGGASVALLERAARPSTTIKAGSINLASAEILARRGLLPAARELSQARVAPLLRQSLDHDTSPAAGDRDDRDDRAARDTARRQLSRAGHFAGIWIDGDLVDPDDPDVAGHSEALGATMIAQQEIESLLAEHAARLGVRPRRGVVVREVHDDGDHVRVGTSEGELRAAWLVGCDGGRSVVRHAAGFGFPGSDPEITGRQAVVELDDPGALPIGWHWTPRGVWRHGPAAGTILTVEFDGPPADRDAAVTREELELSLRRVTGTEVAIRELHGEATRWTDNARQASEYRRGRVLLAGDAAHVHSPFSGQGLNLGLGDATNLGWKLAAVVNGRLPVDLLDSYTAERHPVGAAVLDWTRAQVALMRPDAKTGRLREVLAALMRTPQGMTQMVNRISGVTQRVELAGPPHPLLGALVRDRSVDGRSLRDAFASGRLVLLDGTGDGSFAGSAAPWGDRVRVITDVPGDGGPRSLLARPDGVVAWALDGVPGPAEIDALGVALAAWAGDPESS